MSNDYGYKYFSLDEFKCSETGDNKIIPDFVYALDQLRKSCGFPFTITSGYRSPKHSKEASKPNGGGSHTKGWAADIKVNNGSERYKIVEEALKQGFSGIGVANSFVHVDLRPSAPVMWTY